MASSFDFYNSPLFKMSCQPATRRIFPTNETWNNYGALLEYSSSNNLILHENLFPDVLMKPANRVQASDDDELMMTNTLQYKFVKLFFLIVVTQKCSGAVKVQSRLQWGKNFKQRWTVTRCDKMWRQWQVCAHQGEEAEPVGRTWQVWQEDRQGGELWPGGQLCRQIAKSSAKYIQSAQLLYSHFNHVQPSTDSGSNT